MATSKRVVAIGDLHAGHAVGLTPPWRVRGYSKELRRLHKEMWSFYVQALQAEGPIDVLLVNGDLIDGKGGRSGGVEILVPDLTEQCDIAAECIREARAKSVVVTYGTPYHVSGADGTDYEALVAREVGAAIGGHEWVEVNGRIFDVKHKVSGSQVPHGRFTALAREQVWNLLWAERGHPKAEVLLRSHVHYHVFCGTPRWLAMTLPPLQGLGSIYGTRQCSGTVDFGLVAFDVPEKGGIAWRSHVIELKAATPKPVRL